VFIDSPNVQFALKRVQVKSYKIKKIKDKKPQRQVFEFVVVGFQSSQPKFPHRVFWNVKNRKTM